MEGDSAKANLSLGKRGTRGVPNQFYRNAPWRHLHKRQLEKQPLCEHCLQKKILTVATVGNHIKPIRFGGEPLDENNVMSLCKSCHARKSAIERHMTHWTG
ncbi:HNH endonuclease [Spirosoma endophyticum]|uniref:HNH endonuclease n=1 Tax=Spirosoma endophyticum TaxID=662367 RepID=UPI000B85D99C